MTPSVILRNIVLLFAARFGDIVLTFLFTVYLARKLGPIPYGQLSFAIALTSLFYFLSDLGIHRYLNKEVAKNFEETRSKIGSTITLKLILSAMMMAAIVLAVNLLRDDDKTRWLVYIFGFYTVIYSYQLLMNNLFRGLQRVEFEFIPTLLEKFLLVVFGIFLLKIGFGILAIAFLYLALKVIFSSLSLTFYQKGISPLSPRIAGPREQGLLLKGSLVYGVNASLWMMYLFIDRVILSSLRGDASVGLYQSAMGFALFLMLIPEAIGEVVFPNLVQFHHQKREELHNLYKLTLKVLTSLGCLFSLYFLLFPDWIIGITFGEEYHAAVKLMPLVGLIVILRYAVSAFGTYLIATNHQLSCTVFMGVSVFLCIALNAALIPPYDYPGSTWAAFISNAFLCAFYFFLVKAKTNESFPFASVIKIAAGTVLVIVVNLLIPKTFLILQLCGSPFLFIFLLLSLRVFSVKEINLFRDAVLANLPKTPLEDPEEKWTH